MHTIPSCFRRAATLAGAVVFLAFNSVTFAADGYGRNATGGAGGANVTATTAAQLRQYAESATTYTITVSGTIDLGSSGRVDVKSNKTIKGANTSATIKGTLNLSNVTNVIIQNLNVSANTGEPASNDGISVNGSRDVFITKCTVYDCTDGAIDICKGSDNVTMSWCKFYYTRDNGHNYVNLIGSSDTDTGGYHITFHHNWYSTGCKHRMPADRFGPFHLYNNYYNCPGNSFGAAARNVTQMLAQNNYFQGVHNPLYKEAAGLLRTSGNTFVSCTGNQMTSSDSVFTPPYSYTLDATSSIPSLVQAGAGNVSGGGGGSFPPAGTYSLRNRSSGLMLDTLGATGDGTNVGQWSDGSSNNQRWVLSYISSNVVKLQCVNGGKYLDGMGRTTAGSLVGQWTGGSSNNQRWTIIDAGSGYFKLKNVATGLCLDVGASPWANGDIVEQWPDGSSQNMHWQFVAP